MFVFSLWNLTSHGTFQRFISFQAQKEISDCRYVIIIDVKITATKLKFLKYLLLCVISLLQIK